MKNSRLLQDGPGRAMKGARQQIADLTKQIKATVESKYHSRMAEAGIMKRLYLRYRMKREVRCQVKQEVEKIAPTSGLYTRA